MKDTPGTPQQRARRRFWRLKREGKCIQCREPKPPERERQNRCQPCQRKQHERKMQVKAKAETSKWGAIDRAGEGPRCKCGLLMPCNNCIPSIFAFASIRRDGGALP